MEQSTFLQNLVIIFGLSLIVVYAFHKLRLPSIAGFLMAGALIGPYGLNLIAIHDVKVLAEIGVILLLFTIGLEFSISRMRELGALVVFSGTLQVGLTTAVVVVVCLSIGLSWDQSIFWGFLFALSSTVIVLKMLGDRGELNTPHGKLTIGILLFQDVAVVPMMLLTPVLAAPTADTLMPILRALATSVILAVGVVMVARILVPALLFQIVRSQMRELFVITILLICAGIAWITSEIGLSLALGAFIAGLVISESEYGHQAMAEVTPFRDSFNSLFFISIGMLMDVRSILEQPLLHLEVVLAVLGVKLLTAGVCALFAGYSTGTAILSGLALAQVGELSFVLAQVGQSHQLLSETTYQVFLAVSVITMMITPLLIQVAPRLAHRIDTVDWIRRWTPGHVHAPLEPKPLALADHVIILGYGLNGRNLSRVLHTSGIQHVILDMNGEIVRKAKEHGTPIYYGDGSREQILRHIGIGRAKVMVVAISHPLATRTIVNIARKLNPRLHIIVRTRYLREVDELHLLGANEVVPEEFETSIEMFSLVLECYGTDGKVITQKAQEIRHERYARFRSLRMEGGTERYEQGEHSFDE